MQVVHTIRQRNQWRHDFNFATVLPAHTIWGVSQLSAHHTGISVVPEVITDGAPSAIYAQLYSSIPVATRLKSQEPVLTRSCQAKLWQNIFVSYCKWHLISWCRHSKYASLHAGTKRQSLKPIIFKKVSLSLKVSKPLLLHEKWSIVVLVLHLRCIYKFQLATCLRCWWCWETVTVTAAFSVPYFIKGYPVHSSLHMQPAQHPHEPFAATPQDLSLLSWCHTVHVPTYELDMLRCFGMHECKAGKAMHFYSWEGLWS